MRVCAIAHNDRRRCDTHVHARGHVRKRTYSMCGNARASDVCDTTKVGTPEVNVCRIVRNRGRVDNTHTTTTQRESNHAMHIVATHNARSTMRVDVNHVERVTRRTCKCDTREKTCFIALNVKSCDSCARINVKTRTCVFVFTILNNYMNACCHVCDIRT